MTYSTNSKLTRRGLLKQGSQIGAGLLAAPFVLQLSACSGDMLDEPQIASAAGGSGAPAVPSGGGVAGANAPVPAPTGGQPTGAGGRVAESPPSSGGGPAPVTGGSQAEPAPSRVIAPGAVLFGLYAGGAEQAARAAAARLDFSWLKPGQSVLIKVASNSGNTHPAVTSPAGVRGIVAHLKALGAGRVIVADQAGVMWSRSSAQGKAGGTRQCFERNGLGALRDSAELYFFDEQPFDTGYFAATLPAASHWQRNVYLPSVVRTVDHVLYMPRIAQHVIAGLTLAQKSAVGWLRDDCRHDLHNDAANFYEKYTEVSYTQELRDRIRMAITVSEQVLLHSGPDDGTEYQMSPALVVASSSLPNHDAACASVLVTLDKLVPAAGDSATTYDAARAPVINRSFAGGSGPLTGSAGPWTSGSTSSVFTAHAFADGITKDRALARGWELSGGRPAAIDLVFDGAAVAPHLLAGMMTHGEGLYRVT